MKAELIVHNIGTLVIGKELPTTSNSMENIEVIENAYLTISNGKILDYGIGDIPKNLIDDNTLLEDVHGKIVTPGIVDSHTHLVHYGSRENELPLKIKGVPYLEILRNGGGILSTVRATRKATKEELFQKAKATLDRMLCFGVTTVESKSGYGLTLEEEIKQLEVNQELDNRHPIDIVSTFMGAHAIPEEHKSNPKEYVNDILKMLPIIKEKKLAEFCDIFCEDEVFSVEDSRKILTAAKKEGYLLKIHADEIVSLGGAELAGEIGTLSAEHLMAVSDEGIKSLKENNIIANILPATSFNLGKAYAPVRKMINEGVRVAISSDYNPGSCPTENMQLVMQICSSQLKLTPLEIFKAVTLNAAMAVNRANEIGSLEKGKKADFVIYNTQNLNYIFYNFGINHVQDVYKNGKCVVKNQELIY
ncbi:MAG: imidazolonepropionase [Fusobacterium mortiferum]|jgi:imidazolonepropionase|uniref:imidazolonepropionase n=1 Tax=Fusobacterium mortiferum TaxID=850 RepID=UPI001F20D6FA|nr:imidazolonepropionase [Fusobacterium mortiferum]MCF2698688.1 imidazolonepropionase [Fusobacterium mortiferum]MCI7664983.1 imidazolonepropionase [Fusobacterium mortiferum]MDY2802234.1 imidazolonepropionase [Fusobacterium mortiferum]MDY5981485.1 imidazolonepropionase [Fusobacterium mortiferum]